MVCHDGIQSIHVYNYLISIWPLPHHIYIAIMTEYYQGMHTFIVMCFNTVPYIILANGCIAEKAFYQYQWSIPFLIWVTWCIQKSALFKDLNCILELNSTASLQPQLYVSTTTPSAILSPLESTWSCAHLCTTTYTVPGFQECEIAAYRTELLTISIAWFLTVSYALTYHLTCHHFYPSQLRQ